MTAYIPGSMTVEIDSEAAGVPEERQGYRSRTQLALKMLQRALERGPGDALRPGCSRRHYGLALGAGLDQSGISVVRASP